MKQTIFTVLLALLLGTLTASADVLKGRVIDADSVPRPISRMLKQPIESVFVPMVNENM